MQVRVIVMVSGILFGLLHPLISQAGRDSGGGGGVIRGNSVYVVDLVEAGVENSPFFDDSIPENPDFSKQISAALKNVPNVPVALISRKLNEIYTQFDHFIPIEVILMMQTYRWQMLDFSLVHIPDETPVVDVPVADQVQLAARVGGAVKLDKKLWSRLNPAHKAALIIHEALYALALTKNSDDARAVVGYLFSSDFKSGGLDGFVTALNEHFDWYGTSTPLMSCPPGNKLDDCGGVIGFVSATQGWKSIEINPGATLSTKAGETVSLDEPNDFFSLDDSRDVCLPSLDPHDVSVPNATASSYEVDKIVKTYCEDLVRHLATSDTFYVAQSCDAPAYSKSIRRSDILGVNATGGYQLKLTELDLDQSGAFLVKSPVSYPMSVLVGKPIPWSNVTEAGCEVAERQAIEQTTSQIEAIFH